MSGGGYGAEITVTGGQRAVSLGEVVVRNRRLALRWLRRQAVRLAEGIAGTRGCDGGAEDVRSAVLRSRAVLDGLRDWAGDQEQQDQAMARLESGCPDAFTVVDPVAGLLVTLTGRRVRPERAAVDQVPGVRHDGDGRPYRRLAARTRPISSLVDRSMDQLGAGPGVQSRHWAAAPFPPLGGAGNNPELPGTERSVCGRTLSGSGVSACAVAHAVWSARRL